VAPDKPGLARSSFGAAVVRMVTIDFASAAMSLLLVPYLIRRVGLAQYGIFAFLSVLTNQLSPLLLGVGQAVTVRAAEARGRGDVDALARWWHATAAAGATSSLLYGIATVGAWPLLAKAGFGLSASQLLEVSRATGLVALLMAVQPLTGALQGYLYGCERYRFVAAIRAVQSLVRPLLVMLLVAFSETLHAALLGLLATDTVCAVGSWAAASRGQVRPGSLKVLAWDTARLVRAGLPFALLGVGIGLLVDAERLAVAFQRSAEELAYYSIGANGVMRLSLLPGVLAGLLIPRIATLSSGGRRREAAETGNQATRLGLAAVFALAMPVVAVLPEVLDLWLGPQVAPAVRRIVPVLLTGLAFSVVANASNAALKALGRTGVLNIILWLELPLYAALVVGVVRWFGYEGAAVCLLARLAGESVLYVVLAERSLPGLNRGLRRVLGATMVFALFSILMSELSPLGLRLGLTPVALAAVAWMLVTLEDVRRLHDAVRGAVAR